MSPNIADIDCFSLFLLCTSEIYIYFSGNLLGEASVTFGGVCCYTIPPAPVQTSIHPTPTDRLHGRGATRQNVTLLGLFSNKKLWRRTGVGNFLGIKQHKCIILRDFPYNSALFGLVHNIMTPGKTTKNEQRSKLARLPWTPCSWR